MKRSFSRRFPDFLIIGAMKAGTTSVYRDLLTNPAIFMPADKEPDALCSDAVFSEEGSEAYASLFHGAEAGQRCGEASTAYTKLPKFTGVPERAKRLCGEALKLIYVMREPVARIISHHHHIHIVGRFGSDIDASVHEEPELIDYSRYALQASAWLEVFPRSSLLLLRFEDFIADRIGMIDRISRFLEVEPRPELIDPSAVHNRTDGKPVARGWWRSVAHSGIYRRVRHAIPLGMKDRLQSALLPKAPPRPAPPSMETVERILDALREDGRRLQAMMNLDEPVWDEASVRKAHEARLQQRKAGGRA